MATTATKKKNSTIDLSVSHRPRVSCSQEQVLLFIIAHFFFIMMKKA